MEKGPREMIEIKGYQLKLTCGSCPEQYDVFKEGKYVAYFRLRHGYFRASSPSQKTTYYEAETEGDGSFEPEERMKYLTQAIDAVIAAQSD